HHTVAVHIETSAPIHHDIHRFLPSETVTCRRPEGPIAQEAEVRARRQQSTVPQAPAPDLMTHSWPQPLSASTGRRKGFSPRSDDRAGHRDLIVKGRDDGLRPADRPLIRNYLRR